MSRIGTCLLLACLATHPAAARADDLDGEPINYKTANPDNAVASIQKRLSSSSSTSPNAAGPALCSSPEQAGSASAEPAPTHSKNRRREGS